MLNAQILYGVYTEYGVEELVKRLNKILNIKLATPNNNTTVTLEDDILTINYDNPVSITSEDEMVIITTEYSTYKAIKYYYNKELVRNITAFTTSDGDILTVDHLDNGNFKTNRISKTTTKDTNYNKGYYEREISEYPEVPIKINSHYLDGEQGVEEEKIIDLAGHNLYYHHYKGNNDTEYYQEISMCSDIPLVRVTGHLRVLDDLMLKSFERPNGNIIIRGVNLDADNKPLVFYQTIFDFCGPLVKITDIRMDYQTKEIEKLETRGLMKYKKIDSEVVNALFDAVNDPQVVFPNHTANIIEELQRLKEILLLKEGKKVNDNINRIDLMMNVIPDPNYLAFNIYENLSTYEEAINEELGKNPPEQTPKK